MRRTQIRGPMRPIWFFWLCFVCFGQHVNKVDRGTIIGRIVDEFGDPVAGAAVSATSRAGQEFQATTLGNGLYTIGKLVPGKYEITATMNAMKKYEAKGFIVEAGKPSRLDITMVQPEGYLGTLGEEDRFTASSFARIGQKPVPVGSTPRLPDGKPDLSGFWWADRPSVPLERLGPNPEPMLFARRGRGIICAIFLPGGAFPEASSILPAEANLCIPLTCSSC
jgi:Carboxypeptidase regulatory-like domain